MSDMADVLREKFPGDKSTGKIWATPEQIAAALSAAGFGPVQEAREEAWDECEAAKYEIRLDPTSRFWEPYKINPYRKASDDGS